MYVLDIKKHEVDILLDLDSLAINSIVIGTAVLLRQRVYRPYLVRHAGQMRDFTRFSKVVNLSDMQVSARGFLLSLWKGIITITS